MKIFRNKPESGQSKKPTCKPRIHRRLFKDSDHSSGQGLVEFVLVLPVLILILFGALDLGRAFHAMIVITNAAREGARYGTLHPANTSPNFTIIRTVAIDEAANSGIVINPLQVQVTCSDADLDASCDRGQPITVTVQYTFDLILGAFFPSSIPLSRSVEMMVP